MRLIDADKIYPDCMTKYGRLAISQSQIANAPTINPKEFEPLIQEIIKILPDIVNACIDHLPEFIETNTHNCPFGDKTNCGYYPDGCGKCVYNNP